VCVRESVNVNVCMRAYLFGISVYEVASMCMQVGLFERECVCVLVEVSMCVFFVSVCEGECVF